MSRLNDFWTRPEVRQLIESELPPRMYLAKLQEMLPSGYQRDALTITKIYRAKHVLKGKGNTSPRRRTISPRHSLQDRKLELAYEVLGLEVREEVERQRSRTKELEQRIKELEQVIHDRDNQIKQLTSDVKVTEEAYKRRALQVAGIVHGSRD